MLYAAAETPGGRLPFFTTQLTAHPALSSTRVQQVRALATIVAERSSGRPFAAVVAGDLNAEPDSDEVPLLCGHRTAPAAPGLVLVDAWRYADGGPGWTWDRRIQHVAVTGEPSARIDYVLVGLPVDGRGAIRRARVADADPVGGI